MPLSPTIATQDALCETCSAHYLLESTSELKTGEGETQSSRTGPSSLPRACSSSGRSGVPSMAARRLRFAPAAAARRGHHGHRHPCTRDARTCTDASVRQFHQWPPTYLVPKDSIIR
eukprot:6213337-Pleurochrysis_carterae.AAC.6